MKKIKKERVAIAEKKLLKLRTKLEGRLKVMDVAMVRAQEISKEIEKIRNKQ
jgi:hypothetical protein